MNVKINNANSVGRRLPTMFNLSNIVNFIISVSDLGRGQASKIISDVSNNKAHYIVIKNNKPEAVIVPVEDYIKYTEAIEDIELLSVAESRLQTYEPLKSKTHEEMLAMFKITQSELDKIEVEIE